MNFEKLEGAVVALDGISSLRSYLKTLKLEWHGLPVEKIVVTRDEMKARIRYPDGTSRYVFFGYVEDVAHNVQLGHYEALRRRDELG